MATGLGGEIWQEMGTFSLDVSAVTVVTNSESIQNNL